MSVSVFPDGFDDESLPPPQSQEEFGHLSGLVSSIADFPRMTAQEQNGLIVDLESYECYRQVDQLLRWRLSRPERNRSQLTADYLWLMKINFLGLESFESFAEVAKLFIRHLDVTFVTIRLHILDEILGPENFKAHAKFLKLVLDDVKDVAQKVLLLERLALIFEKKIFVEHEFEAIYFQILKLDTTNVRARKFFKLSHLHNMEWAEAAEQLKVLVQYAENPQERARYSHELAQLYLYNLNQPAAALELLRPLAVVFPETRYSLIEALERLDLLDDLLASLASFERSSRDIEESSQFKYRRGNALLKVGRTEDAVKAFRDALQLQPGSLLIHESLIAAIMELGAVHELENELARLRDAVKLDSSFSTLDELLKRAKVVSDLKAQTVT
jgi:tetratricopeptide (TPR) repeat protein